MTSFESFRDYVRSKEVGEVITIRVLSNNRERTRTATIFEHNGNNVVGVTVVEVHEYETDPVVELNFQASESGPSGGLMLTLAIYNNLVTEDITNGLNIVGTGAINAYGTVREVGGIEFKLNGAIRRRADVFIVPIGNNYEEAVRAKRQQNSNIKILGVSSVEDAINQLRNLENN